MKAAIERRQEESWSRRWRREGKRKKIGCTGASAAWTMNKLGIREGDGVMVG